MKTPLFVCSVGLVAASWMAVVGMTPRDPQSAEALNVARADAGLPAIPELAQYTIQTLSLPTDIGEPFGTFVELDGDDYYLTLTGTSLRSDDFKLLVQQDDGTLQRIEPPTPRTYKGQVDGIEDAWVAGSVVDDGLSLTVALPDGRRYEVAPLAFYVDGAGPGSEHVVFRSRDTILPFEPTCATDTSHAEAPAESDGDDGGISGTSTKVIDVSFDTDAEFYVLNGSSSTNTMFDIENVMVRVENIYEAEVNATYEVTTIIVRTNAATDPYSSNDAGTLLNQFTSHWQSTKSDVRRDVAHMMTGRNLNNGTLGIAQLNQTCNTNGAYGLSESRFTTNMTLRACVTAHEIGHNFNGLHCSGDCSSGADCRIMCPCVNGCAQDCLHFGAAEESQIEAKIAASACLQAEALPVAPPFFDDFPNGTINISKWAYIDGVAAVAGSVAPPSGTIALQLNANVSTEFGDDEIRSTFITLGGLPSATVSYQTEARGVEAGEQLVVEYWAANLRWIELARYTATGTDESTFTPHSHVLTGTNALHNEFRLRFRVEVDQSNDNWWVDDVSVSSAGAAFSLNIDSSPSAAAILVSPNDLNGQGGGVTPFGRTYTSGALVTLTAPATHGGNSLGRWTIDGVDQPAGQTVINVNMNGAHTCVALYPVPTFLLSITTTPSPGALILVNPTDANGQASGVSPLNRQYPDGTVVLLQAPLSHAGEDFRRWVLDGVNQAEFDNSINFTVNANMTAEAVYQTATTEMTLTVNSLPSTGVNVTVTPNDNNGAGNGVTNFTRLYDADVPVTLTAPDITGGLTFRRWTLNGVDMPVDQLSIGVTMSVNTTALANYRLIGDANCDGQVDFFDIDPFLIALFNPATYASTYCDGSLDTVDCDGSGAIDFFDIDAFLAILFG